MKVKELRALLEKFDEEASVAINDRGIYRDVDEPIISTHMNGECVLLQPGTWSNYGYTIEYAKRYGYEMILNKQISEAFLKMSDSSWIRLRSDVRMLNCELEEDSVTMYDYFEPAKETIGPNCPRNFSVNVYSKAQMVMDVIKHAIKTAEPDTIPKEYIDYVDQLESWELKRID